MRDDRNGAPNGRPSPFGHHSNGEATNGVAQPGNPFTRLPAGGDDAPIDLVAVQADDELVNALAARPAVPVAVGRPPAEGRDAGGAGTDDRLLAMLAAWRAEIDAEPIPELVDLDSAVAAVVAGVRAQEVADRRRRAGRLRQLAPLAAAAAIIVATVTGVGLGSQNAVPGDVLWPIQKVVNPERAESVETKIAIEGSLQNVRDALKQGDTDRAAQLLESIRTEIPAVRGEEGQTLLVQEREFLAAKLADTPPGTPADLTTPPTSNPAALPTSVPAPPPASDVPSDVAPPLTGPSGSEGPTTDTLPTEPGPQQGEQDPASILEAPAESGSGGGLVVPEPDPPAPQVTSAPEVTQPETSNPGPDPENSEGRQDGSPDPGTVVEEPQPSGSGVGAGVGETSAGETTSDTPTASGPPVASDEATPTAGTS